MMQIFILQSANSSKINPWAAQGATFIDINNNTNHIMVGGGDLEVYDKTYKVSTWWRFIHKVEFQFILALLGQQGLVLVQLLLPGEVNRFYKSQEF